MEGFGVVLGVVIGIFLFTWLKVKIFGDSSKDEDTSDATPARSSVSISSLEKNPLVQEAKETIIFLLGCYGIFDEEVIHQIFLSCYDINSFSDFAHYVSKYESKEPPSGYVFRNAIKTNYEALKKMLDKNGVPYSLEVEKNFDALLDKCDTVHSHAFYYINQEMNFTGVALFGIKSINYFMFTYHFYLQAVNRSSGFMSRMTETMHNAISSIGREQGVLNDDQVWTDGLEWGDITCCILDLTITPNDLLDVTRIFDKLDASNEE